MDIEWSQQSGGCTVFGKCLFLLLQPCQCNKWDAVPSQRIINVTISWLDSLYFSFRRAKIRIVMVPQNIDIPS